MNLKLAYSLMIAGAILCLPACKKDPVVEKHKQTSTSSSDNNSGENNGQQPSSPDKDAVLTRIEVVNPPVQTTYLLRSEVPVNLEGLVVEGIYSNGERKKLDITSESLSGFSTEKAIEQLPVIITVEEKQTSFMVKVIDYVINNGVLTEVLEKQGEVYRVPAEAKVISPTAFAASTFDKIILSEGVEEIQADAFTGNSVKEVVFPKSLKTLGEYCFYGCRNLSRVDLSDTQVQIIPKRAFSEVGAEEIKLPVTLREISSQAFLHTDRLHSMTFPEDLKTIGVEAFRESGVESVTLPDNLNLLEERAFYLCQNLREVRSSGNGSRETAGVIKGGVFQYCPKLTLIEFPESIESIGQTLFSGVVNLDAITLGKNLKKMAFNALGNSTVKLLAVKTATPPSLQTYALPLQVDRVSVPKGTLELFRQPLGNVSLRSSWGILATKMEEF